MIDEQDLVKIMENIEKSKQDNINQYEDYIEYNAENAIYIERTSLELKKMLDEKEKLEKKWFKSKKTLTKINKLKCMISQTSSSIEYYNNLIKSRKTWMKKVEHLLFPDGRKLKFWEI